MGIFLASVFGFFVFCGMVLFFGIFGAFAFLGLVLLIGLIAVLAHATDNHAARLRAEAQGRAQAISWAKYQADLAAWEAEHGEPANAIAAHPSPKPEKLKVQRADGRKPWYLR